MVVVTVVIFRIVVEAFATLTGATFFGAGAAFFGAGLEVAFFGVAILTLSVTATIFSSEVVDKSYLIVLQGEQLCSNRAKILGIFKKLV